MTLDLVLTRGLIHRGIRMCMVVLVFQAWSSLAINAQSNNIEEIKKLPLETLSGVVLDHLDRPVEGAFVFSGFHQWRPECLVKTDQAGRFELPSPVRSSPGPYLRQPDVWAYSPEFGFRTVRNLEKRKETHVLRFMKPTPMEFQIVDEHGAPIAGATASVAGHEAPNGVYSADESTGLTSTIPRWLQEQLAVKSDAKGKIQFKALPKPLIDSIVVTTEQYGSQQHSPLSPVLEMVPFGSIEFSIQPDEPMDFSDYTLFIVSVSGKRRSSIRSEHRVTIEGDKAIANKVVAGDARIFFNLREHAEKFRPDFPGSLKVVANQDHEVTIRIRPTTMVEGEIYAGGKPVEKGYIYIGDRRTMTDANGKFRVRSLPGKQRVQMTSGPIEVIKYYEYPKTFEINVPEGKDSHSIERIEMEEKEKLSGIVVDADNRPIVGGRIRIPFGYYESHAVMFDIAKDGSFEFVASNSRWREHFDSFKFFWYPGKKGADKATRRQAKLISKEPLKFQVEMDKSPKG